MNTNTHASVVTRMPPSPTGYVHIGNVRTLLFTYLFAKKNGGKIIFRSEDTDRLRSKREYEDVNSADLKWLGLSWDEFYRQSERTDIYHAHLQTLITSHTAYVSKEDSKQNPGEIVEVVRLKNPGKKITFVDEIRGEITFDTTELGDIVIARSMTDPVYHFAAVVDDFEMGVTHVIRGEEHISNTPRQILIQEAIGAPRPLYAHLPLILAPDHSKLSKRHGAIPLHEYRAQGFLKGALINYLALLGWSPRTDRELFTLPELIEHFDFDGFQKSAAIFNIEKLTWFNREHLKKLPDADFRALALPYLPEKITTLLEEEVYMQRFERLLPIIRERTSILSDITKDAEAGEYDVAFFTPHPSRDILMWKADTAPSDGARRLQCVLELIATLPEQPTIAEAKEAIWPYAEQEGRGEVLWPLRVALSGREKSPDPFTLMHILGTAETFRRVKNAYAILSGT